MKSKGQVFVVGKRGCVESRADVVLEVGGFSEGHEKSLPCSEVSKYKLLEKLVCPAPALQGGKYREVVRG